MKAFVAAEGYPLRWPTGWKRTPVELRKKSTYGVTLARARLELICEVQRLGGTNIVLSTNVPLRRDGAPYAGAKEPEDGGCAVYWTRKVREAELRQEVMACDKWRSVRENIRALGLAIHSLRTLQRTGATDLLERAFEGFAVLPESAAGQTCWAELKIEPTKERSIIEAAYRRRAREVHPDTGGSHEAMVALNAAYLAALETL